MSKPSASVYHQHFSVQRLILERLGQPADSPDCRLPLPIDNSLTLRHLVRGYLFPDPATADLAAAEGGIREILAILQRKGVVLHGARWLGGREYYRWLQRYFLSLPLPDDLRPERPVAYHFTQLQPNGVDNIFRSVEYFIDQLFCLQSAPNHWWIAAVDVPLGQLSARQERYLAAWQAAFLRIDKEAIRPLAVHDLTTGGVKLDFRIDYEALLEDRSTLSFGGKGQAWLLYLLGEWRITGLDFPEFSLPVS